MNTEDGSPGQRHSKQVDLLAAILRWYLVR